MTTPAPTDNAGSSTRPYLIRALHDWCTDNGFTPYIAVHVDGAVRVPMEYVKDNEIVLNVGFEATSGLKLGNEWIEFKARFSGGPREIFVPVDHVIAIYARENGQGMAFPTPVDAGAGAGAGAGADAADNVSADRSEAAPGAPRRSNPSTVHGGTVAPLRGLRLASADAAVDDHLQGRSRDDAADSHSSQNPNSEEPPPPAPTAPTTGTGRPSLKRVK
ncbi:MAG: Stringent starvation protein [Rhizobacter sp.]|nr:Stringent starvation protein [Rhizobacter sp.]